MKICRRPSRRFSDLSVNMARPGRLELPTLCLEGRRSIQLSYGRAAGSLHSKAFLDRTESIGVDIEFLCVVRGSRFSRLVQLKPLLKPLHGFHAGHARL